VAAVAHAGPQSTDGVVEVDQSSVASVSAAPLLLLPGQTEDEDPSYPSSEHLHRSPLVEVVGVYAQPTEEEQCQYRAVVQRDPVGLEVEPDQTQPLRSAVQRQ